MTGDNSNIEQEPVEAKPAGQEVEQGEDEHKPISPHLLRVWYVAMISCTVGLWLIGRIFHDDSVFSYVWMGIVTICIVSVVRFFMALAEVRRLNEARRMEQERIAEQNRKTVERRMANMSIQEREELEQEKARAAAEFAKRHAEREMTQETPHEFQEALQQVSSEG